MALPTGAQRVYRYGAVAVRSELPVGPSLTAAVLAKGYSTQDKELGEVRSVSLVSTVVRKEAIEERSDVSVSLEPWPAVVLLAP